MMWYIKKKKKENRCRDAQSQGAKKKMNLRASRQNEAN